MCGSDQREFFIFYTDIGPIGILCRYVSARERIIQIVNSFIMSWMIKDTESL